MAAAEYVQIKARARLSLRKALEKAAARNERSVNAEMIARLEESLQENLNRDRHSEIINRLDAIQGIVKGDFYGGL